jgi:hypothetical protein
MGVLFQLSRVAKKAGLDNCSECPVLYPGLVVVGHSLISELGRLLANIGPPCYRGAATLSPFSCRLPKEQTPLPACQRCEAGARRRLLDKPAVAPTFDRFPKHQ